MKTADATTVVRQFGQYLSLVESGETVRITKHGRAIARLVPDCSFMSGQQAAALFRNYEPSELDRETANLIAANIAELDRESDNALAH